ncbi:MAG: DUF21 domain-containing protein [Dehalococcoidia bacterium]|nr:DUF21 domain-containing protein [Dehalococcoidia bacterium]
MSILVPTLIIAALILLNGLFVAAEFAIVGAPRASVRQKALRGRPIARLVDRILTDPRSQDRYIATAQLGITFATLGLGMYGEHQLAHGLEVALDASGLAETIAVHAVASVLAVAIMTYFHIVIGEMVPKSLALQRAERTATLVTPPMLAVRTLLYPLVIALNGLGNGILRVFGINRQERSAEQYHTAEELQFIVEESLERGALRPESGRVLRELFEFGDFTADDVLTPRVMVAGIPLGATPDDLRTLLRTEPHTRYPVYTDDLDDIVGVLHARDILRLLLEDRAVTEGDVRPVPFVPETARLQAVMAAMSDHGGQLAVVLDEHGGTAGVVTSDDLSEEIVGAIEPETLAERDLYVDAAGRLHVAGTTRIEEVGERLDVELEHEDVDTVSGLILMLLGRPPAIGDSVEYRGVSFQVTVVEGHGVREAVVALVPEPDEDGGSGAGQGEPSEDRST